MSEGTFERKKAGKSNFSHSSLVSPTTPTLANPVRGFGLPTNNVIQTQTSESTNQEAAQPAAEESLLSQAIGQRSFSHDISRIALRRPQAKLTVGAPNDVYEQEADRVAQQVISMPDAKSSVQREAVSEEEEEIQTKPWAANIMPLVQRQAMPEEEEKIQAKGLQISSQNTPAIQRDINSDLIDALVLSNWSRAANLLNQMNDTDLNANVRQQSPETLLGLQRAAGQAHLKRVVQAIKSVQLRSGTQVENVEGTTFRTPVTLFQSGVVISKDIRFVKRGRFRSNNDFETLKNRMINAVRTHLTNRFKLKIETPGGAPQPGDGEYSIRVQIVDNQSASYVMQLFGQRHGRGAVGSNSGDIFELGQANETLVPDTYLAHECSHVLLGAHDEYAEAGAPASRQVFTDNSLMGNFYGEGIDQAEIKPRHFGALVRLVSGWFPGRNVSIIQ